MGKRKHNHAQQYIPGPAKAETSPQEHFHSGQAGGHSPFSDGGIEPLPVRGRDKVVVAQVLLVVLLDSGAAGAGWFFPGEYISSHLLLLFCL